MAKTDKTLMSDKKTSASEERPPQPDVATASWPQPPWFTPPGLDIPKRPRNLRRIRHVLIEEIPLSEVPALAERMAQEAEARARAKSSTRPKPPKKKSRRSKG